MLQSSALWEQGEGTAVLLQALTESELQQQGFLFKTHLRTLKFEPISGKSVCGPVVAGRLPAQPSVPRRTGPHPFAPLLSTPSILLTQGKPSRDYALNEQCSA